MMEMEELISTLQNRVDILQQNVEYCGGYSILLKNYKKSAEKLFKEINSLANDLAIRYLFIDFKVLKEDRNDLYEIEKQGNLFFHKLTQLPEYKNAIKNSLYKDYSVQEFLDALKPAYYLIMKQVYLPYFIRNTKYYADKNGKFHWYNRIYDLWLDEESGLWINKKREGKVLFPHTYQLLEQWYEENTAKK